MSPIDHSLVQRKLLRMVENLKDLEDVYKKGLKPYLATRITRKLAERLLQETIEAASDLNSHILVEKGFGSPQDYREGFLKLSDAKILTREFCEQLAPAAGLRNRIVHEYEELDDRKVFQSIKTALKLFPKYIKVIRTKLN